jgi:hypothetical protein
MDSPTRATTTPSSSLPALPEQIGLHAIATEVDDFLARATKQRWSPRQIQITANRVAKGIGVIGVAAEITDILLELARRRNRVAKIAERFTGGAGRENWGAIQLQLRSGTGFFDIGRAQSGR